MEKRREGRITPIYQPKGELYLVVGERHFDIRAVRDISPFGIGLQIDSPITNGTEVQLKYLYEAVDLDVRGIVIWNMTAQEDSSTGEISRSYRVGISLYPDDQGVNLQFFKTLTGRE